MMDLDPEPGPDEKPAVAPASLSEPRVSAPSLSLPVNDSDAQSSHLRLRTGTIQKKRGRRNSMIQLTRADLQVNMEETSSEASGEDEDVGAPECSGPADGGPKVESEGECDDDSDDESSVSFDNVDTFREQKAKASDDDGDNTEEEDEDASAAAPETLRSETRLKVDARTKDEMAAQADPSQSGSASTPPELSLAKLAILYEGDEKMSALFEILIRAAHTQKIYSKGSGEDKADLLFLQYKKERARAEAAQDDRGSSVLGRHDEEAESLADTLQGDALATVMSLLERCLSVHLPLPLDELRQLREAWSEVLVYIQAFENTMKGQTKVKLNDPAPLYGQLDELGQLLAEKKTRHLGRLEAYAGRKSKKYRTSAGSDTADSAPEGSRSTGSAEAIIAEDLKRQALRQQQCVSEAEYKQGREEAQLVRARQLFKGDDVEFKDEWLRHNYNKLFEDPEEFLKFKKLLNITTPSLSLLPV